MKKALLLGIGFFCWQIFALDVAGKVSSHHGWQGKGEQQSLLDRNWLLLELSHSKQSTYFFSSVKAMRDNNAEPSSFELTESYFDYFADSWDVRVGRQIIAWGKADGLRITDIICPQDFSLGLSQDLQDSRLAVDAFKFSFFPDCFDLELIYLPFIAKAEYPLADSLWNVVGYKGVKHNLPTKTLEAAQIAGRLGKNLGSLDFAVSGYYFWLPVQTLSDGNLVIDYKRTGFFGLEASASQGSFVYRLESAYYQRKFFAMGKVEKPWVDALLGVDCYPGGDWTIMAQFSADLVCDYSTAVQRDESESLLTLTLKKKVFRQQLEFSAQVVNSLVDQDIFCKFSSDYDCSQGLHILVGYDYYDGERKGDFGKFADNSMAWCKAEYSF